MDTILFIILILLFGATLAILYLVIKFKKGERADETNEIANLNDALVRLKNSLNSTFFLKI